jgi:retron-type reverse transcriptase
MALFAIAKVKAHSLTGRITTPLLHAAFKAVKRNRGAAGVDRVSIKMFETNLVENLSALERDLKNGSFRPFPSRRMELFLRPLDLGLPEISNTFG